MRLAPSGWRSYYQSSDQDREEIDHAPDKRQVYRNNDDYR